MWPLLSLARFCFGSFRLATFKIHVIIKAKKYKKTSRATSNVGYEITSNLKAPLREVSSAFDFFSV